VIAAGAEGAAAAVGATAALGVFCWLEVTESGHPDESIYLLCAYAFDYLSLRTVEAMKPIISIKVAVVETVKASKAQG
jgi:hypothetical protein